MIKERDRPFGVWQLRDKEGEHAIKVTGPLSSNHGEIVHQWCLEGQGIALRSWWDVRENIASGNLLHLLPEYYQPANIWAVYVSRLATSAKIRATVEFLRRYFQQRFPQQYDEAILPTAGAVGRGD
ncbi:LysR family transcriptional regulator [Klebsiella pneumoniae]|nr:LysR family transcriptional regulator [Klebsiella pneumoniae]